MNVDRNAWSNHCHIHNAASSSDLGLHQDYSGHYFHHRIHQNLHHMLYHIAGMYHVHLMKRPILGIKYIYILCLIFIRNIFYTTSTNKEVAILLSLSTLSPIVLPCSTLTAGVNPNIESIAEEFFTL